MRRADLRIALHASLPGAASSRGGGRGRLGVNRYADWTQEEYEALVLPTRGRAEERPSPLADGRAVRLHAPALPPAMLPAAVDWRGTPADSPVKDQAACGSCWVRAALKLFPLQHMSNPCVGAGM